MDISKLAPSQRAMVEAATANGIVVHVFRKMRGAGKPSRLMVSISGRRAIPMLDAYDELRRLGAPRA